jgi:hypothetical protein
VNLLKYIPTPNIGTDLFATSAYPETVRDDKAGARFDANTRFGQLSAYYFVDNYRLDNPYPRGSGGSQHTRLRCFDRRPGADVFDRRHQGAGRHYRE